MRDDSILQSSIHLNLLDGRYAICCLPADAGLPDWAQPDHLLSVSWRVQECSMICAERYVPPDAKAERGWRVMEVQGPLDFNEVGILDALLYPLAQAQVAVFVLSTFETDLILVRDAQLERAEKALWAAGHQIRPV